jgi:hypothetical protein
LIGHGAPGGAQTREQLRPVQTRSRLPWQAVKSPNAHAEPTFESGALRRRRTSLEPVLAALKALDFKLLAGFDAILSPDLGRQRDLALR